MSRKRSSRDVHPVDAATGQLFTLEVALLGGPLTAAFARKNPVISRTLQVGGEQTLHELHLALAEAFGLDAGPSYEFRSGEGSSDPAGPRYLPSEAIESSTEPAQLTDRSRLDSLGLEAGGTLTYRLDDGDDWWFRVRVVTTEAGVARGRYPRVTERVGRRPTRRADSDEDGPRELGGTAAADMACLVGELHLSRREYSKAVEAFSRAIDLNATADAYRGRARAYRALAQADEQAAGKATD